MLNFAKYAWMQPDSHPHVADNLIALKKAGLSYSPAFLRILAFRGARNKAGVDQLIQQDPKTFHNPFLLYQMDRAIERIQMAIMEEEPILIYGDYDADGVTSALILSETLESLGALVTVYLPNRFKDGYGPNKDRYQAYIDQGIRLIITCDNGVAGHEAIAYAQDKGVDVIVTDHHELQPTLPEAYAVIHPRHPKGAYPFGDLSGAGVALKVVAALLEDIPTDAVELAMIGTICDMVPLVDENRSIVLSGLQLISHTQRAGLRALLEHNGVDFAEITTDTIGFILGPRLNAVGRLEDPMPAFQLLAGFDEEGVAGSLALVEQRNRDRQSLCQTITQDVIHRIQAYETLPPVIIEANSTWHPGVLGIVAGNIKEQFNRPTILCHHDVQAGFYKGSGRSIDGFNIFEMAQTGSDLLRHFGGHAQALGLTVDQDRWEAFCQQMQAYAEAHLSEIAVQPQKQIEAFITPEEATEDLYREINLLGPFGTANDRPILGLEDVCVVERRQIGSDLNTLKLGLADKEGRGSLLQTIGFKMGGRYDQIPQEGAISLIGYLEINQWKNKTAPQMMLLDFGMKESLWLDCRSSQGSAQVFKGGASVYLFQRIKTMERLQSALPPGSQALRYDQGDEIVNHNLSRLVIMEMPAHLEQLKMVLLAKDWEQITLGLCGQPTKLLAGLPGREEAGRFYRWLTTQSDFEIRPHLQIMSQTLELPVQKLMLLIMMFFDAGFVTIKDGWLAFNKPDSKAKIDIFQTPSYKKYHEEMEMERLLFYQPVNKIKEFFEGK